MNTQTPTIELTDDILRAANTAVIAALEAVGIANWNVTRVEALPDPRSGTVHSVLAQAIRNQDAAKASLAAANIVFAMLCDAHDAAINAEVTA